MLVEIIGIIGGVLFFCSWLLQAWETKRAKQAIVSFNFFMIRLIASSLLLMESLRVQSIGLIMVNACTIILIAFNLVTIKSARKSSRYTT